MNLIEILTRWPLISLYLVLIFRRQIAALLPALSERLKRISVGGNTIEFDSALRELSPRLQDQARATIPISALIEGEADELEETGMETDEPASSDDIDEGVPTQRSEIDELEQKLDDLRK